MSIRFKSRSIVKNNNRHIILEIEQRRWFRTKTYSIGGCHTVWCYVDSGKRCPVWLERLAADEYQRWLWETRT